MNWAYGVTTVPRRRDDLLPRTLASLRAAGWDSPRLFVDGDDDTVSWSREFGLPVTARKPLVRVTGNWLLGMVELYVRDPHADRYAIFQDDVVFCRNARAYLDSVPAPERGYMNLHVSKSAFQAIPKTGACAGEC